MAENRIRLPQHLVFIIAGYAARYVFKPWIDVIYDIGSSQDFLSHPKSIDMINAMGTDTWYDSMFANPALIDRIINRITSNDGHIELDSLCMNPHPRAVEYIKSQPELIQEPIWGNPTAFDWIITTKRAINWRWLSCNPNPHACELLRNNKEKIDWRALHANPSMMSELQLYWSNSGKIYWWELAKNPHPEAIEMVRNYNIGHHMRFTKICQSAEIYEAVIPSGLIELLLNL